MCSSTSSSCICCITLRRRTSRCGSSTPTRVRRSTLWTRAMPPRMPNSKPASAACGSARTCRLRSPNMSSRCARSIPDGALRRYPGSPQLAMQMLRKQDRLRMFELHSTESRLLQQYFRDSAPARHRAGRRRLRGPAGRAAAALAPRPGADRPVVRGQGRLQARARDAARRPEALQHRCLCGLVPAGAAA